MENEEMTNDAAVAWLVTNGGESCEPWLVWELSEVKALPSSCIADPLYSATTVAELRAEVADRDAVIECKNIDIRERDRALQTASKRADAAERRAAECLKFIAGVRDELHNRRTADWYPEGAHNAAEQMSEDMRLIGNACADFDPHAEKETP